MNQNQKWLRVAAVIFVVVIAAIFVVVIPFSSSSTQTHKKPPHKTEIPQTKNENPKTENNNKEDEEEDEDEDEDEETPDKGGKKNSDKNGLAVLKGIPKSFSVSVPGWVFNDREEIKQSQTAARINPSSWKAQDHEDLYAEEHFFYNMTYGVVLESGALNGVTYSTTYGFEADRNWYVVHVEASPSSYAQLIANRPTSLNIHAALCDETRTVTFAEGGAVGGIVEFMAQSFIDQWNVKNHQQFPITCTPPTPILEAFDVWHVDFWILDVEGAELVVLQAWDFDMVSVDVIVIEADDHNPSKNQAVRDLLAEKGFNLHGHVVRNDWFVHKRFKPHAKPK